MTRKTGKTLWLSQQLSLFLLMSSAPVTHTADAPLLWPMPDVAWPTTTLAIAQPPAPNALSVVNPVTGSGFAALKHDLDIPSEDETTIQGTDANPTPTIEEIDISSKKVRSIHINIIIIKIIHNNFSKTHATSNQPSKPYARIKMQQLLKCLGKCT